MASSPQRIYLCQRKYVFDIISETGLLGVKPISHLIKHNHALAQLTVPPLSNPSSYRRLVGRIIYLGVTHLELSSVIHCLSQFMHDPTIDHWEAAICVVPYLKNNLGQGILLSDDSNLQLYAWCDSDWPAYPLTRRYRTAWFIQLCGSHVSWRTRNRTLLSLSSTEVEYRAMTDTVSEVIWLQALLGSLGVDCSDSVPLRCHSMSAFYLSKNPIFHENEVCWQRVSFYTR